MVATAALFDALDARFEAEAARADAAHVEEGARVEENFFEKAARREEFRVGTARLQAELVALPLGAPWPDIRIREARCDAWEARCRIREARCDAEEARAEAARVKERARAKAAYVEEAARVEEFCVETHRIKGNFIGVVVLTTLAVRVDFQVKRYNREAARLEAARLANRPATFSRYFCYCRLCCPFGSAEMHARGGGSVCEDL